MPKRPALCVLCLLLLIAGLQAQVGQTQNERQDKKILKNADIVMMAQNHFDDETLVKTIEVSDTDFDISGAALIDLKNQGVSPIVLRAMLESCSKQRSPAQPAATPAAAAGDKTPAVPALSVSDDQSAPIPAMNPDPNFATRSDSAAPISNSAQPAGMTPQASMAQYSGMSMPNGAARINPQQIAAMRSQMASMGMGGMMGNMGGMAGMGGMSLSSYSSEQMPHVFRKLATNQGKEEITPSTAEIGQSKFKGSMGAGGMALRSLATEGLSFAAMGAGPAGMMAMSVFSMGSGFMPGMRPGAPKVTYVWGLPGRKSARELTDTNPMFELNYGEIPGVDPDAYEPAVLKLVQSKDNYRLVGATQIKMTPKNMMAGSNPENGKWISEDRWPTRLDKEERGFYILHMNSPLEPGEYAVVLRPVKGYKAVSSGLGGHAQVFYSVWDFSVPGAMTEQGGKKKKK